MRRNNRLAGRLLAIMATLMMLGCTEARDDRLAELAVRSLDEQARQNERLAEHSRQITEASKKLVEADADSRKWVADSQAALQQEIETARSNVDRGRAELERERREMAAQRHREPIVAQTIGALGLTLACLLPLLLAAYVIYSLHRPGAESEALGEMLVTEITADEPLLLPHSGLGVPRIGAHRALEDEPAESDSAQDPNQ